MNYDEVDSDLVQGILSGAIHISKQHKQRKLPSSPYQHELNHTDSGIIDPPHPNSEGMTDITSLNHNTKNFYYTGSMACLRMQDEEEGNLPRVYTQAEQHRQQPARHHQTPRKGKGLARDAHSR